MTDQPAGCVNSWSQSTDHPFGAAIAKTDIEMTLTSGEDATLRHRASHWKLQEVGHSVTAVASLHAGQHAEIGRCKTGENPVFWARNGLGSRHQSILPLFLINNIGASPGTRTCPAHGDTSAGTSELHIIRPEATGVNKDFLSINSRKIGPTISLIIGAKADPLIHWSEPEVGDLVR